MKYSGAGDKEKIRVPDINRTQNLGHVVNGTYEPSNWPCLPYVLVAQWIVDVPYIVYNYFESTTMALGQEIFPKKTSTALLGIKG